MRLCDPITVTAIISTWRKLQTSSKLLLVVVNFSFSTREMQTCQYSIVMMKQGHDEREAGLSGDLNLFFFFFWKLGDLNQQRQRRSEKLNARSRNKQHWRRRHEDGIGISRKRRQMHVWTYSTVWSCCARIKFTACHFTAHRSPVHCRHHRSRGGPAILPHRKSWPSPMPQCFLRHAGRQWARGTLALWCCCGPRRNSPAAQELLSAYS